MVVWTILGFFAFCVAALGGFIAWRDRRRRAYTEGGPQLTGGEAEMYSADRHARGGGGWDGGAGGN